MRHRKCEYYGGRCIYCGAYEVPAPFSDSEELEGTFDEGDYNGADYWIEESTLGVYTTETGDAQAFR